MNNSWNEIEREFLLMDDQPCEDFEEAETSPMTNEAVPHECPECGGTRYFCANCHSDHHKDGWKLCFFKKTAHKEYLRGCREARDVVEHMKAIENMGKPFGEFRNNILDEVVTTLAALEEKVTD